MQKTMKDSYMVLCAVIISFFAIFINITLIYKSGMNIAASMFAPLIFYALFRIFFIPQKKEFTYCLMFACGASMATFGLDVSFALISSNKEVITDYNQLIVTFIITAVFINIGAVLLSFFSKGTIDKKENYIFPKGQATANIILFMVSSTDKMKRVIKLTSGVLLGLIVSVLTKLSDSIKYPFMNIGFPKFIGIELSPLLFGVGMLMPLKSMVFMILGLSYSLLVYLFYNTVDFSEHLANPLIMSVAVGLILGGVLQNFYSLIIGSVKKNSKKEENQIKFNKFNITLSMLFFVVFSILFTSTYKINIFAWLLIFAVVLLLSFATIQIRAETGMGLGISAYILIPLIGILSRNYITTLLLTGGFILFTIQCASFLESVYISDKVGIETNKVSLVYLFGSLFGCFCGIFIILFFEKYYGLGNSFFPIPMGIPWEIQAKVVLDGILPASINWIIILPVIVLGIYLAYKKISPSIITMGLLLTPSTTLIICLGTFTAFLLKRKKLKDVQDISTGLITGEGVVLLMVSILIIFGMGGVK